MIEPIEPRTLFNYVQKADTKGFIEYCEALKAKYEFMYDENGKTTLNVGGLSSDLPMVDVKDEVQLFRHVGYQIRSLEEQQQEVSFLPSDTAIQHILYSSDADDLLHQSERSAAPIEEQMGNNLLGARDLASRVVNTQLWNPLIFAIFYGRHSIVKYILKLADNKDLHYRQHLACLLTDPFKI